MRQLAKNFLRTAGTSLGSYLDEAFTLGGNVGQNLATSALKAGKAKFAPSMGAYGKEVPMLLREGSKQAIPTAGRLLGQGAVLGTAFPVCPTSSGANFSFPFFKAVVARFCPTSPPKRKASSR